MPGGQNNIFGTLYEILVFRDLATLGVRLRLTVDRDQADVTLVFQVDGDLLHLIRRIVGDDVHITAQLGDADLGAASSVGLVVGQMKASLNPTTNVINKGDLNKMLAAAVKHVKSIRESDPAATGPIAGFIMVTNRPLGNISDLIADLRGIDQSLPYDEIMCPICLGTTPSSMAPALTQSTPILHWCAGLNGVDGPDATIAADLLLNLRYFPLSIPACLVRFDQQIRSLGLNASEGLRVGEQLNGRFLLQVEDVDSGIRELKLAIFDTEASFHRFTPAELRSKESEYYPNVWRTCGFHRTLAEVTTHISSETTNELIKAIRLLTEDRSDRKPLVVCGPGGIGKSYQLLGAIGALRDQGYGVLMPGQNWRRGMNCLDDTAALFYGGYRFDWRGSIWIERLERSLRAHEFDQPVILYFPNSDELTVQGLEELIYVLGGAISHFTVVLTARTTILAHLKSHVRESVDEFSIDGLSGEDIIRWLSEHGVNTGLGGGTSVGSQLGLSSPNTANNAASVSRANIERIRHPLFFSALARETTGNNQAAAREVIESYLRGDAHTMTQFWESAKQIVAERLHKHLGVNELRIDLLKAAFERIYSNRVNSPWTLDALSPMLSMFDVRDHKDVRNQMLQIGILEEVDTVGTGFRWAFVGYDPGGSFGGVQ